MTNVLDLKPSVAVEDHVPLVNKISQQTRQGYEKPDTLTSPDFVSSRTEARRLLPSLGSRRAAIFLDLTLVRMYCPDLSFPHIPLFSPQGRSEEREFVALEA